MILVNGLPSEHVRVFDRGLIYGDGVFRTLLVRAGHPLCWPRHYDKLYADCAALDIVCPPEAILAAEMAKLIARNTGLRAESDRHSWREPTWLRYSGAHGADPHPDGESCSAVPGKLFDGWGAATPLFHTPCHTTLVGRDQASQPPGKRAGATGMEQFRNCRGVNARHGWKCHRRDDE